MRRRRDDRRGASPAEIVRAFEEGTSTPSPHEATALQAIERTIGERRPRRRIGWPVLLVASAALAGGISLPQLRERRKGAVAAREKAEAAAVARRPSSRPAGAGARAWGAGTLMRAAWLGNSRRGDGDGWALRLVSGLHVTAEGRVFAIAAADELGERLPATAVIEDGRVVGALLESEGSTPRRFSGPITGNDRYLYVAVEERLAEEAGRWVAGVERRDQRGRPAPWPGGDPRAARLFAGAGPIRALAAGQREIYVVRDDLDASVVVLDAETLEERRRFRAREPRALAVDGTGAVWIIEGGETDRLTRYGPGGAPASASITDLGRLAAVTVDQRGRPIVARAGGQGDLLVVEGPAEAPRVRPLGAAWPNVRALGVDAGGRLVVGANLAGGWAARIVALGPDADPLWQVGSSVRREAAAVDPASDGREVFTLGSRFGLRFDQPGPPRVEELGWTVPVAPARQDPRPAARSHGSARIFHCGGRRFLAGIATAEGVMTIYRFTGQGHETTPVAMFGSGRPPGGARTRGLRPPAWIWRDLDADGAARAEEVELHVEPRSYGNWIDEDGTVWRATERDGIDVFPCEGVDARGVPIYRVSSRVRHPMPAPFVHLARLVHTPEGALYLGGFTAERPWVDREDWLLAGTEIARYDGPASAPVLRWRLPLARGEGHARQVDGFAAAGERLFVSRTRTGAIEVYDARSAARLGTIAPTPELGTDFDTSHAEVPLSAFRRSTGETLLFAANPALSNVLVFRIPSRWPDP